MQLYQRKSCPFWWYDFTVGTTRYRESTKRLLADRDEAQRVMALAYEKHMNIRQFGEKPEITLREAMDRCVKSVTGSTRNSYITSQRKWLGETVKGKSVWHLDGNMLLSHLTQGDLDDHRSEREDEELKPNSINIETRFIQRTVNIVAKRFATPADLDFTKLRGFIKTRFLTEEEQALVASRLASQGPSYDKAEDFRIFLTDTGARLREAAGARWADLDLDRQRFEVYRSKTKTLSVVPLSERTLEMLRRRHNQPQPFPEMSRAIRLLRKTISEVCNTDQRLVDQRGAATIHTLRDTYASKMVQGGMSLHELAKLLGHTTAAMSAKYGHLEANGVSEKAQRILNR